ncbi:MAG: hypothetical protein MUE74_03280 [Bacteroidales bacterium]|jgi:hypothetical protein|nr:hypothetical protein [Bacteroidales bacterium]
MPELSLSDIDQISSDVRSLEITFSHLSDELIDHICCDVEAEMLKGISFSEAYRKIKQKIGSGRRLKEIQEETLYAVDSKYRKMKNTMKISGVAGTILFGCAALFKIMHWPIAGVLMTMGALILALVFMPSALSVLWKETHSRKRLFLFISVFFAALFFISGILFKVQHWPGAGLILTLAGVFAVLFFIPSLLYSSLKDPESKPRRLLYVLGAIGIMLFISGYIFKMQHWPMAALLLFLGLFILFVVVLPWYTHMTWKNENFIRAEFIFLVVGSMAVIIPASMVATNIQRTFDNGYFTNLAQQKAVYDYLSETNASLMEMYSRSFGNEKMQQLHSKTDSLIRIVNQAGSRLVSVTETKRRGLAANTPGIDQAADVQPVSYENLSNPFNMYAVQSMLSPGTKLRTEIESALQAYKTFLTGIIPSEKLPVTEGLLDPAAFLPLSAEGSRKISMISGLHSLALLKNAVLTAENSALKSIIDSISN